MRLLREGDAKNPYTCANSRAFMGHPHGTMVFVARQRTHVLVVTSAQMITADMVPDTLHLALHRHNSDHMAARYEVISSASRVLR